MALDQNEILELLELFPEKAHAIERFHNTQIKQKDALDKLTQRINQLKEELRKIRVSQSEEREKFLIELENLFKSDIEWIGSGVLFGSMNRSSLYSRVDNIIAEYQLINLNVDDFVDDNDRLIETQIETKRIFLDAWNANLDNVKSLESTILDLQTLKSQLTE